MVIVRRVLAPFEGLLVEVDGERVEDAPDERRRQAGEVDGQPDREVREFRCCGIRRALDAGRLVRRVWGDESEA
ncbi:hypothetical protein [Salinispora arenicola]|uniref:hypothetical protein n=1 Tax=Salinispora arenicola TaxID=168697 RepID=UPI0018AD42A3|nr:hypothetical protein [Salinispora arenicola]